MTENQKKIYEQAKKLGYIPLDELNKLVVI